MDEKIRCVLTRGGVNLHENNGTDLNLSGLLSLLESWLGFNDDEGATAEEVDNSIITMEDARPFDQSFYRAVEDFLIEVWKPDEVPQHKFFGLGSSTDEQSENNDLGEEVKISLYKSIVSVRVMRLLRHWMELNVGEIESEDEMLVDEEADSKRRTTLSFQLLNHCSFEVKETSTSDSEKKFKFFPLIQALYQHVEQLPFLQSQIFLVSQAVTRGNGNSNNLNIPGLGLANPQSRLAQRQAGERVRAKLEQEFENHINDVEYILGEWYEFGSVEIRRQCRAQLGSVWSNFEARSTGQGSAGAGMRSEDTSSCGVAMTLRILHRILMGIEKSSAGRQKISLCKSHEHLLFNHLIPLHRPNSFILWRDQKCLLDLYHEPLVQCIATLLKQKPEWTGRVIEGLLSSDVWNKGAGNTPKLVLLLHEIDAYIGCLPGNPDSIKGTELGDSLPMLLRALGSSMASENSRLAQRALPFVKNKKFVGLIEKNLGLSLDILLPFLLRKEPSWNPTVRKMTYNVLALLRDFDLERFIEAGNRCFAKEEHWKPHQQPASSTSGSKPKPKKLIIPTAPTQNDLPTDFTIESAMGTWVPPPKNDRNIRTSTTVLPPEGQLNSASGRKNPPLTVTGVAPWAMKKSHGSNPGGTNSIEGQQHGDSSRKNPPLTVTGVAPWAMKGSHGSNASEKNLTEDQQHGASGRKNPPLTVTGVAPWAMKGSIGSDGSNPKLAVMSAAPWATKGPQGNRNPISKRQNLQQGIIGKGPAPWKNNLPTGTNQTRHNDDSTKLIEEAPLNGEDSRKSTRCRVLAYMEKIKPPEEEKGISSWSKTQMAESPTLLPTLKFYDLVFGHDLGEGAFGSVRYARLIDKTTTRSNWPEYAVKVISTEKIKAMGYEASVQRELSVLRVLSHPCIARVISSFRFREGVYLVLEYASGGDLHTLLKTNGSLDHSSTRFVIGEVTSALASIHEIGLGYFDLKPENIVITESGHLKLTDFGGVRPVTKAAKAMIRESARNVFNNLRDGDWKTQEKKTKAFDMDEDDEEDDDNQGFTQEYDPDADIRIEGTTIYLPPEVVSGAFPTLAADSWALGCVLFQCLAGRPPILEVDETAAKKRIVSFNIENSQSDDSNFLFGDSNTATMESSARDLITQLMNRDANERPTMIQVADHPFFQDSGMDIFALWREPALKLEVGAAAPPPQDAAWARRHLSSIWAPQPQAYNVSSDSNVVRVRSNGHGPSGPIPEGQEAHFFFSKSNILPSTRLASQVVPMPPRKKVAEDL